jgi:hypothetical protein
MIINIQQNSGTRGGERERERERERRELISKYKSKKYMILPSNCVHMEKITKAGTTSSIPNSHLEHLNNHNKHPFPYQILTTTGLEIASPPIGEK